MSHFTYMKTRFQNLSYLEKALNKLKIEYKIEEKNTNQLDLKSHNNVNLVIPQSNGYDNEFTWNGQEYEFVVDRSFWEQTTQVESFINNIAQKYAKEAINGESQKIGFQPIKSYTNSDGSSVVILERWSNK